MVPERPAADGEAAINALAAQCDLALQAASGALLSSAQTWHTMLRAYVDLLEAGRRTFGGLLVDLHEGANPRGDGVRPRGAAAE
jgi:hypothetical protein